MSRPKLTFEVYGKVAKGVVAALEKAWENLKPHFRLHRSVKVELYAGQFVGFQYPDGTVEKSFGAMSPDARHIALAAMLIRKWPTGTTSTRREAIMFIVETFCHELGHYEQHRDGKEPTERGIHQRTKRLLKMATGCERA